MSRAPFQVLVIPYRLVSAGGILYAIFRRNSATGGYWQWIAGGGEERETPLEAARREASEEAGIPHDARFMQLDSLATLPVEFVSGFLWGEDQLVIPEHSFGVRLETDAIILSAEHIEYRWVDYQTAGELLKWDSNRSALWELDLRLRRLRELKA
jgi:dATP pyrophosphohydrolase